MPFVTINMFEGRTREKKAKMHDAVAKAISESLDIPLDRVSIQIVDMKKENVSYGGIPQDEKH